MAIYIDEPRTRFQLTYFSILRFGPINQLFAIFPNRGQANHLVKVLSFFPSEPGRALVALRVGQVSR